MKLIIISITLLAASRVQAQKLDTLPVLIQYSDTSSRPDNAVRSVNGYAVYKTTPALDCTKCMATREVLCFLDSKKRRMGSGIVIWGIK